VVSLRKNAKVYYVTRQALAKALKDVVSDERLELLNASLEASVNARPNSGILREGK
jgi:hypothetical protein